MAAGANGATTTDLPTCDSLPPVLRRAPAGSHTSHPPSRNVIQTFGSALPCG